LSSIHRLLTREENHDDQHSALPPPIYPDSIIFPEENRGRDAALCNSKSRIDVLAAYACGERKTGMEKRSWLTTLPLSMHHGCLEGQEDGGNAHNVERPRPGSSGRTGSVSHRGLVVSSRYDTQAILV